ncbi:Auxin-responsive protein iaa29 [Thalictrum thalictroides]|uniref:Auxin-responsive protein n=1 Tax=Thalictrum thalictroides TaxID=46969 RepID=A0A7J6X6P7_THATH|nr:Auxin-responsive protein iaa29 [Thalictrum thalictroides]
MELQLGLALPFNPMKGFDLNNQHAYEPIDSRSKKRAFDDLFHDTRPLKETLRLVSWDNLPNEEDDHENPDRKNTSYSMNQDDREGNNVMGWPPISSWRKKHHHHYHQDHHQIFQGGAHVNDNGRVQNNGNIGAGPGRGPQSMYVKVKMDGVPIGRKVDLHCHHSYQTLTTTLTAMFEKYEEQHMKGSTYDDSRQYILTYQDRDGDWLLVGDVPYQTFIQSVQRLSIKRTSGNSF